MRPVVALRLHQSADVPILLAFEQDPAWAALSMTKPRDAATFQRAWAAVLAGGVCQRAILVDGVLCGTIGCLLQEGPSGPPRWMVGYGLGRAYWGQGIASAALGLLLRQAEVPPRPLFATAAASNRASIRVLEKHGFVLIERRMAPETPRGLAREEVTLVLAP